MDQPDELNAKLENALDKENVNDLFIRAMIKSLSLFNKSEANPQSLKKAGYDFKLLLVGKGSDEIHRTAVGKTPLINDIF